MLSPLTREDSCTSRFTTCAPRRLAASSKLTRVRVEGSVKRLATVAPASAWLIAGVAPRGRTKVCARSSSRSICSLERVSRVSRWRSEPSARSCSAVAIMVANDSLPLTGKPAPEDHRGGGAVDVSALHAPAELSARAPRPERLVRLERGEALIDQLNGQCETAFELGGEAADRGAQG